jgi:hypothetical protein
LSAEGDVVTGRTKTSSEGIRRYKVGEEIRCVDDVDGARDAPLELISGE